MMITGQSLYFNDNHFYSAMCLKVRWIKAFNLKILCTVITQKKRYQPSKRIKLINIENAFKNWCPKKKQRPANDLK